MKKVWLGKVSVREHIYKKALRLKESLGITYGKEYMFIPYEKLKTAKSYTDQKFISKYDGKSYRLVDFDWKPYKEENTLQLYVSDMSDMHVRRAFKRLLRMIRLGQLIELSDYDGQRYKSDIHDELGFIENHVNKIRDKLNE